jgi:hypothetical protein
MARMHAARNDVACMQGWVLEQCCPRLRPLLEGMPSLSAPLELPPIAGMDGEALYNAFSRLVEYSYTGSTDLSGDACARVWVLAASFGYASLKVRSSRFDDADSRAA